MKVFILGGYGAVGVPSAELLAKSDLVSEIAFAGRNMERAEKAAAEIGDKARAVQVDGADEEQLALLLTDYDIIVNAANNQVALTTLHAAVRSGAHYCDVGWGRDFIAQMQEFSAEARDAGVTAIICNGISPCITNLMGVHAARQLDETEQLQGGRPGVFDFESTQALTPQQWLESPQESLVVLQKFRGFLEWMLQVAQETEARTVRAYQDGRWLEEDTLKSGFHVPLPNGRIVTTYPYGSYDPIFDELPDDLAKERPVCVYLTPFPPQLQDLYAKQTKLTAAGEVEPANAMTSFYETIEANPDRWLTITDDSIAFPLEWVSAVGRKEGRAARYNCWLAPDMWNERVGWLLTSVSLTVTVLRILSGKMQERGVMTAEKTFDPLPYLDEVASLMPELPEDGKLIGESFEWLE
ncbi:MAG: hypothetical protein FVQ83_03775 [Chloroflexi bacterium]|nr:hypothetical protein [Chloroflexota bacterium]